MTDTHKIPTTVVTGFLGAGKTSLIRHLLETANGRRLALIINEFGDLGVDGEILKGCGIEGCQEDDVLELANGCICCTVAEDFVPTMERLLDRPEPPDHIVIETSGLALPKPLVKAFNWPEIRTRVTVDGVVAVIDGAAKAFPRAEASVRRILLAEPLVPLDGGQRLSDLLCTHASRIMGETVGAGGVPLYTDARHYAAAGVPTVLYGAGPHTIEEANAHRADERLPLDDLFKATAVVALTLRDLLRAG